jgi:hypothetical protein
MKERWTLYGEVTAGHGYRRVSAEEELLTLWALDVNLADDLRSLFEEAVTDSLAEVLGTGGARTMAMLIGAKSFESPRRVSEALDAVFHEGSEVLKRTIAEEFRANLHLLCEKMKKNSIQESQVLVAPISGLSKRSRGLH